MSHLWIPLDARGAHGVLPLEEPEYALPLDSMPASGRASAATLVRVASAAGETWVLLVSAGAIAQVNGVALSAGLAVLGDRDEIRLPGSPPLWFSTETIARVEDAPAQGGRVQRCPRCLQPIEAGSPAVLCPNCRVWHHQSTARPCFTYQDAPCAACQERFELDGCFRWSPEEL